MKISTLEKHIEESCLSTPDLARLAIYITRRLHRRSTILLSGLFDQTEKDLLERYTKEDLIKRSLHTALLADTESKTATALKALVSLASDKYLQMKALDDIFDWRDCLKTYRKK